MKNSVKKIVSMALAVATTCAVAVTAFAADYGTIPVFPATIPETSVTTSTINAALNSVTEESGEAVIEVKSERSITVNASVMRKLADSEDKTLTIKSEDVTISIDASTVTNVKKVNLSMNVVNSASQTIINMKSKAELGCEAKIVVTSVKMSAEKLAKAHVYCDGEDLGPVELNEDGYPVITVTKGGRYVIK